MSLFFLTQRRKSAKKERKACPERLRRDEHTNSYLYSLSQHIVTLSGTKKQKKTSVSSVSLWCKNNLIFRLILSFIFGIWLFLGGDNLYQGGSKWLQIIPLAQAQTLRPEMVAEQVYQKMPELPKENQYLGVESNQIEAENTLLSRLIRYHQYIKSRPSVYRIDWQLTLADYLGVNEEIKDTRYPGSSTLKTNPMAADIQAINQLSRTQRNQLIDYLLLVYNRPKEKSPQPQPTPSPAPTNNTPVIIQPKPGAADLLKF